MGYLEYYDKNSSAQKHIYLAFVSSNSSYISVNAGIVVQPAFDM